MANPVKSLNASIDWQALQPLLVESTHPSYALPAHLNCPLCTEGTATIYPDHLLGGQWFHCTSCHKFGDMITLAAQVWQLDLQATVCKLAHAGIPVSTDADDVRRYHQDVLEYQLRLRKLWKDARENLRKPQDELARLIYENKLRSQVSFERWKTGPRELIGGMDTESIERVFAPRAMAWAAVKRQRSNPSKNAIFRGPGWNDTLLLPFYDLPQRICGYFFMGREGRKEDLIYRRANLGSHGNQYQRGPFEAGLALHPQVLSAADDWWERKVIATNALRLALQLQTRQFEQSTVPLPLAVWYDSRCGVGGNGQQRNRTMHAWQMLGNRQIVFWMPQPNIPTILQAIATNGLISTAGPRQEDSQSLSLYVAKFNPRNLCRHIFQMAKPWHEAVSEMVGRAPNSAIERLVYQLQSDGVDVERELQRCNGYTRRKVRAIFTQAGERTCQLSGKLFVEKAGGWYLRRRGKPQDELLMDAHVRLEAILSDPSGERQFCRGRLFYRDNELEFCANKPAIDRDLFGLVERVLVQQGLGCLAGNRRLSHYLPQLARQFHPPKFLTAVTKVGWSAETQRYVFPKFNIARDYETKNDFVQAVYNQQAPAQELRPCAHVTSAELCHGTPTFWGVLACYLANVLSRNAREQPMGIGLQGANAIAHGLRIAKGLGCRMVEPHSLRDIRKLLDAEHEHHWPVFVHPSDKLMLRARRLMLERTHGRNLVLPVAGVDASLLALAGGWQIVRDERSPEDTENLDEAAASIVPAYLRYFLNGECIKTIGLRRKQPFVHMILQDLQEFTAKSHFEIDLPAISKLILAAGSDRSSALADVLVGWVQEGRLRVSSTQPHGGRCAVLEEREIGKSLYLPRATFLKLAERTSAVVPPVHEIEPVLVEAGALLHADDAGWLIDAGWLRRQPGMRDKAIRLAG